MDWTQKWRISIDTTRDFWSLSLSPWERRKTSVYDCWVSGVTLSSRPDHSAVWDGQFGWPHSFAAPKFKRKSSYIIIVGHLPPCRYIKKQSKLPIIVSAILISVALRDRKRGSRLFGNKKRGCGLPCNLTRNLRCSSSKMPGTNQIRTNDEICLQGTGFGRSGTDNKFRQFKFKTLPNSITKFRRPTFWSKRQWAQFFLPFKREAPF